MELIYTAISLVYGRMSQDLPFFRAVTLTPFSEDLLAFLVILHLSGWQAIRRFGVPGILGTILKDATIYFFVIFTAHFVLAMTLLFARVSPATRFTNHDDAEGFI